MLEKGKCSKRLQNDHVSNEERAAGNVTLKDISKTLCRFSYSYMDILAFFDTF